MRSALHFPIAAVLTVGILPVQQSLAETMTKTEISNQIIGRDLSARHNGVTVRLRYNPDGSVAMKAAFMSGAGTWSYAGDGLCMILTKGPRRGKTCVSFEDLGNGTYRNSEGLVLRVRK